MCEEVLSMKKILQIVVVYFAVFSIMISIALAGSRVATTFSEQLPENKRTCIIIDAGHGGVDGGATSCTGVLESQLNLQIALRLNDLMHLLGMHTVMIRTDDRSVYTEGESIAAKKVSDLKERVCIVNSENNAILVSIHQNTFPDSRYSGAQVFYSTGNESADLAKRLQSDLVSCLNPGSRRAAKQGSGIYLLENINTTGVLVECGFLSNPTEEAKLRSDRYQQKLSAVIAAAVASFLSNT